jgi:hypothetical protein
LYCRLSLFINCVRLSWCPSVGHFSLQSRNVTFSIAISCFLQQPTFLNPNLVSAEACFSDNLRRRNCIGPGEDDGQEHDNSFERKHGQRMVAHSGRIVIRSNWHQAVFSPFIILAQQHSHLQIQKNDNKNLITYFDCRFKLTQISASIFSE